MNNKKWTNAIKALDDGKSSENENISNKVLGSEIETNKITVEEGEIYLIDENKPSNIIKTFDKEIKSDEINIPNEFIDLLIGKKTGKKSSKVSLLDMPIAATNILFRSIALVKSSQFNAKARPIQLELFEEEFKTKQNAKVSLAINVKDISSNVRRDGRVTGRREKVREAIDFLQNNLFVWVIGKNSTGETVDTKLSYIESPSFTKGKVFFDMNVFWFERLLNLKLYNTTLLELPELLGNTRHVVFSVYLERFTSNQWIQWNYKNINETFALNYSDANNLAKGFLRELRHKLDKNSLKSFQYRVDGDNIWIMPYEMKNLVGENKIELQSSTLEKLDDNYFANSVARKHKLSKEKKQSILDIIKISTSDKNILKSAYEEFKRYCRSKEVKVSILKYSGEKFLNTWNKFIFEEYKKTDKFVNYPNGFPRV
ncbi:hypothetical protein C1631_023000 [Chryseobacterium phosphatilyticum]|uniref:Uncharacterized protein n=1 Tax=Chryseobacterium phosphatilyticum TaxID=475075 RepID=A0A316WPL8_9FLAO|nr:hypothetical protein [Chryseobacterium phosphatilyticum]PWN62436.1 hypothetical protein C1631_023000 [Chryseobacterium phosphatilyticum]